MSIRPSSRPDILHHRAHAGFLGDIAPQGEGAHPESGEIHDRFARLACGVSEGDGYIRARFGECQG